MARAVSKKPAKIVTKSAAKPAPKPVAKAAASARRPAAAKANKAVKGPAPAKKPAAAKAPVVSKDELRSQLEKAEKTIATLRAKGREANRELKAAAARVDELEAQVARLEKKLAAEPKAIKRAAMAKKPQAHSKLRKARGAAAEPTESTSVPGGELASEPVDIETPFED